MTLTKDLSVVYEHLYPQRFNFQPCKLSHWPPLQINDCLSLGFTKTDYEMSFNFSTVRVIPHITQYEKFEMKPPGCEILGRAARTLAPLTNFRCALSPLGRRVSLLKEVPLLVILTKNLSSNFFP